MPITIELPPEEERRLNDLAAQTGRDVDFYLPEIIQCGLEGVKVRYLAEAPPSGIPTIESLREKHDSRGYSLPPNARVRTYRALSWLERGQKELAVDSDAAFIFHWIGFDALCSGQPPHPATKAKIHAFIKEAIAADWRDSIYNCVIAHESKTVLTLVANAYVFAPFWKHYYGDMEEWNWADSLLESINTAIKHLGRGKNGAQEILKILFDRLYELRNQLVHGGATWRESVNRDQVEDGARIMSHLLPFFLDLAINNPNKFSDEVSFPPPEDPAWIIAEHNDYVFRLAKLANKDDNSDYREYLVKAIERELKAKKDPELTARVREILNQ